MYPKQIIEALEHVRYPGTGKNLIESGMLEDDIRISGYAVSFSLIFEKDTDPFIHSVIKASQTAIKTYVDENAQVTIHTKWKVKVKEEREIPFIISRIARDGKVLMPDGNSNLQIGDILFVLTKEEHAEAFKQLIGVEDTYEWKNDEEGLVSRRIVVTRSDVNGKKIYRSFTASTKKDAELLAAQYKAGRTHASDLLTVTECISEYIKLKKCKLFI